MKLRLASIIFTVVTLVTGIVGSLPELQLGMKLIFLFVSIAALLVSVILWIFVLVRLISRRKNGL